MRPASVRARKEAMIVTPKDVEKIKLGVSACLLGHKFRYDGTHQRDPFVADVLGPFVEYIPVCPEVECGLGIPREAMRLEGNSSSPRLVTHKSKRDLTDLMIEWAKNRLDELEREDLCGFIFKSRSPSSGMERVKVYNESGAVVGHSPGIFAKMFMERFPYIPVEDEGRLNDPKLRENFIERVFVFHRWRHNVVRKQTFRYLIEFHERHKLILMAHSPELLRKLGRIVASGSNGNFRKRVLPEYEALLWKVMKLIATTKKHSNVLYHCMGFLKRYLLPDEKQEMIEVIEAYRAEHVPLIVPITLINHYVRKYKPPYLEAQYYLNPHPIELRLRNRV
ncbi:MAG: DUF523 and DUF1722 domain-containing protein [Syntrophobacterales bacterium]|nr:DUF523 and DUF1722 domain-containing protein [Syntrophobacterales bacterium]